MSTRLSVLASPAAALLLLGACSAGRTTGDPSSPPDTDGFEAQIRAAARAVGIDAEEGSLEVFLAWEATRIVADYDEDGDVRLEGEELEQFLDDLGPELDRAERSQFENADSIGLPEVWRVLCRLEPAAAFTVDGTTALMVGTIDGRTPARVAELVAAHPEVRELLLGGVPGSVDDEANLAAARAVRAAGLATRLAAGSIVASGGTDFFLAGATRSIAPGARVGVHSWGGGSVAATEVPRDHPEHRLYLEYYEEMQIPAAFYWFTLEAAPADDMHWMTAEELARYGFETR